ncbi:hypothetical protein [Catenuloplanes japonicus]|uniref:hypothetical protein n=1 Tax=Catenuloplanes japonicus TaxID=33876 RepID=UPI0012FC589F|nr:hypothetical protein [Catenuloplanes japonicus]
MSWTEADGEALFRQPASAQVDEEKPSTRDDGPEAMRRLRNPFETDAPAAPARDAE